MRAVTHWLLAGAGAVSLCASGCFGPMYNPYGNSGMPGYSTYNGVPGYGAPGSFQTLTPGSQYVPGGTLGTPSGPNPTPTYDSSGNAAPWGGGSSIPVPNPSDPSGVYFPNPSSQYTPQPGENYRAPSGAGTTLAPGGSGTPFSGVPGSEQLHSSTAGPHEPAMVQTAAWEQTSTAAPAPAPTGEFAGPVHEVAAHDWVEGIVRFDPADRTWNIVYDHEPQTSDPYAGRFTLSASPLLQTLRDGERVRLEGEVDPVETDRLGKPTYLAQRIIRGGV